MPPGEESQESWEWRKIRETLPKALWEAIIDAAKAAETANPLLVFFLQLFRSLQVGLKEITPEQRAEVARALRRARFEDLEANVAVLLRAAAEQERVEAMVKEHAVRLNETQALVVGVFKALGEMREFQRGEAPDTAAILDAALSLRGISRRHKTAVLQALKEVRAGLEDRLDSLDREMQTTGEACRDILDRLDDMPGLLRWVAQSIRDEDTREFEREYLNEIRRTYGYLHLLGVGKLEQSLRIDPAFVSLSLRESRARDSRTEEAEVMVADQPALVVIGDAGAGKTTLLQWEAVQCAMGESVERKPNPWHGAIPFFIRLRDLDPGCAFPSRTEWIRLSLPDWGRADESRGQWVEKTIADRRALLILDGLDEMPHGQRRDFWRELRLLVDEHDVVYRVSSRPSCRESDDGEDWRPPHAAAEARILPLSQEKADGLIDRWHEAAQSEEFDPERRRQLVSYPAELKRKLWRQTDYRKISQLARTPLLCAAICLINRYSREKLPQRRPAFLKTLCEALLERDDRKKRRDGRPVTDPYNGLTPEALVRIHAHLAYNMVENPKAEETGGAAQFNIWAKRRDVLLWLEDAIGHIDDESLRNQTKVEIRNAIDYYKEQNSHQGQKAEPYNLLTHLLERRNLLREPGKDQIDFHHRALLEYLAATALARNKWLDHLVDRALDDRWRDTIVMAPGGYFAGDDFGESLIRALLGKGRRENSRACVCLAVACLDTALSPSPEVRQEALDGLRGILPLRSFDEAREIAAAGEAAVSLLREEGGKATTDATRAFYALALISIGGGKALEALSDGYGFGAICEAFRYASPSANILDIPLVLQAVETAGAPPLAALEHIRDLSPLSGLESPRNLNLRCCESLASLEPLRALTKLERVDLSYCSGQLDVSPLEALPALSVLEWLDRPEVERLDPKEPPADPEAGDVYFEILDGARLKMVWVPDGTFRMGSPKDEEGRFDWEGPQHDVKLSSGFWLSAYPVTQSQYEAVIGENPSHFKERPHNPVEQVSWVDAMAFCKNLSQRTGGRFTLPAEAQWEYACRAGSTSRFCFGDSDAELGEYAWYAGNSGDQTQPVGRKKPNAWGLYDMHGNVWEWCLDDWHGNYENAPTDGSAWVDSPRGSYRVIRGGGWLDGPGGCRSAIRGDGAPGARLSDLGFRVLAVPAAGREGRRQGVTR